MFGSKKCQAAMGKTVKAQNLHVPTHKHQVDVLPGNLSMDVAP